MSRTRIEPLVKPFLKWAGGKRQLLPEIRQYYPTKYNNYFEPFLGAGAVFFDLQPKKAILNDFNVELINTYNVIKYDVDELIEILKIHDLNNTKEYFYKIRELDRTDSFKKMSDLERAGRFIFLNKTCFNGLFRVNSQGQFNVPYGSYKNPAIVNEAVLRSVSLFLNKKDIEIHNGDYEEILKKAKKNDFIYLDPPYAQLTEDNTSFVGYTINGFGVEEQERLRDVFVKLDKEGCFVLLSNSSVPLIHDLYRDYKDTTQVLGAKRSINSKSGGRGKVDEVLISNYILN